MNRRLSGLLLLPALLLVAACTNAADQGTPEPTVAAAPFADCSTLTTSPVRASTPAAAGSSAPAAASATALPDVRLPCFTGGAEVPVAAIRGPAVLNFWASWCPPCRKELPAFQRLADRADGRVHVIGVNTTDDRGTAASLGKELKLTFPNIFDEEGKVRLKLARAVLPITVFVDGQGQVRHVDTSGALDDASLAELVERHLAVAVPL
ncbi:TlpA family protein disulfide reductase [Micromonospora sp. NPDC003197]